MKKFLFILIVCASCNAGRFTIVTTEPVDIKTEYVLLQSNVSASAGEISTAIKKCIRSVTGGVYLQDAVVTEQMFGYKVTGNVYGKK